MTPEIYQTAKTAIIALVVFGFFYGTNRGYAQESTGDDIFVSCTMNSCTRERLDCELSGGGGLSGSALFYETGILPGDTVTRKIEIEGNNSCGCDRILLDTTNETQDIIEGVGFAEKLFTAVFTPFNNIFGVHSGIYALPNKNLNQLFAAGPILLGELGAGQTKNFFWTVTFDKTAGNEFQNKAAQFDFDMEFKCGKHIGDVHGDHDDKDDHNNHNDNHNDHGDKNHGNGKKWYSFKDWDFREIGRNAKRDWFFGKIAYNLCKSYNFPWQHQSGKNGSNSWAYVGNLYNNIRGRHR